jgi:pimeloyl-ACP methyl ester carboxylesterase
MRTSIFARRWPLAISTAAVAVLASACASAPLSPYEDISTPLLLPADIEDERGRFRDIFCMILEEQSATLPDVRPCDEALTRIGDEPGGSGWTVDLGQSRRRLVAAIVPGVGWGCFSNWLDLKGTTAAHVRQFGYDVITIDVDALSSSSTNARQIRDAIIAMEPDGEKPRLVLIGYSKGAPDILEAVVSYPEIRGRIAAVVSVAGAVGGSPVADEVTQSKLELLKNWPGAECSSGDGGALESLRPETRHAWLAENTLPRDFPYYSLVTCPQPDNISPVLKPSYKKLRRIDPRNDGMMLFDDQVVPGSTFLGCVNADHWAVSVPIARTHPNIASLFVDENDYPREALLEALLRFVEEDLAE